MLGYSYPLFLSPGCPFTVSSPHWRSLPSVTECSSALQLSSVLGGSWWLVPMCQASLPCVPYSLPSPEALPQQDFRARGFIMHSALPKIMSFDCFQHFYPLHLFFFLLFLCNIKKPHPHKHPWSSNMHQVHSCPRHGGRSPPQPVLYGRFLEGDPILFLLPLHLASWLALVQRGVRWRGPRLGQCAQKLINCRQDAGRQPARSSGERPSHAISVCLCDGGNWRDSADNLI